MKSMLKISHDPMIDAWPDYCVMLEMKLIVSNVTQTQEFS